MTRRLSSKQRRQQIVRATLDLLATSSVETITTRRVARRVGVSQPALFRHFTSRDQILVAVVEHTREQLEGVATAALAHRDAPLEALETLLDGLFNHMATHPGLPRLLFFSAASDRDARYHAPIKHLVSAQRALVGELVNQARDQGEVPREVDEAAAALLLVSLIQGTVLQHPPTRDDASADARDVFRFWLAGVRSGLPARTTPSRQPPETEPVALATLDVRPILADGNDPLDTILGALRSITPDGLLMLTAPFEPRPLIRLLSAKGYRLQPRKRDDAHWLVEIAGPEAPAVVDLRDLEAPGPAEQVLLTASKLEPGGSLLARVPQVPRLLIPLLDERGLVWQVLVEEEGALLHVRRSQP